MLISETQHAEALDWDKADGLLPAVVQDSFDGRVLMQAWMNREALLQTLVSGRATFWSRSRQAIWTKGETSGHFLTVSAVHSDCDRDSILVLATPLGPTCHRGCASCFDEETPVMPRLAFLAQLQRLVEQRDRERPAGSYTTQLFNEGTRRIAQKVGEEGVETALAATSGNDEELCNEAADLVFHLLVLLQSRRLPLERVIATLSERQRQPLSICSHEV
jgi:phosphoribosyl-ATP pyrophosphohydrolase/phosphoribosyl-AMP cyclohydrolase